MFTAQRNHLGLTLLLAKAILPTVQKAQIPLRSKDKAITARRDRDASRFFVVLQVNLVAIYFGFVLIFPI